MPDLSRIIIKTALVYLLAALLVGVLLTPPGLRAFPQLALAVPAQVHLLVVGWLSQLIFGVAHWLFPRYSRERPHGRVALAWMGYAMLNAGLLLRLASEPFSADPGFAWAVLTSAVLQWAGCLAFVGHLWPRVKEK
ncbi:MAG: hypothetical protein ACI80V_003039 [Rhodothermales bacterium]|jgi:hypothetical protein